jgi:segregation and condensation protein A
VLLHSRLLFPANPGATAEAEKDAAAELRRLDDLAAMRAAGVWLQQRPRVPREAGYVALMEARLTVLRGREGKGDDWKKRRSTGRPFRIPGAW